MKTSSTGGWGNKRLGFLQNVYLILILKVRFILEYCISFRYLKQS